MPGSAQSVSGHFIQVPKNIATGKNPDGSEITSADVGYPAPPTDGSWQTGPPYAYATGIDGPQWVLEYWSQLNNVFDFVRVEDIAYDKRPAWGTSSTSSTRAVANRPVSFDTPGCRSTNGRVWKMVLDPNDPTVVTSLSIAVEGDDNPVKTLGEIHQPDNIETTQTGFLVTEDPGSSQQFVPADPGPSERDHGAAVVRPVLRFPPGRREDRPVGGRRSDRCRPAPTGRHLSIGNWGAWETTGIVDASAAFGPDAFLINVQAHTLWVEKAPGTDSFPPAGPDFTYKREGGQLLLLRIPGV